MWKGCNSVPYDPEHIAISKSTGLQIDWTDNHHSGYPLSYLRDECPCATCTGAHGTMPQKSSYSQPQSDPFPMFKPALKMIDVEEVGNYALRIIWNDGHSSGIYSWDYLRSICPCGECERKRAENNNALRPV
jgi:DUF971 family protein